MRYWFDTEFVEDGRTIDLISIGMVAEDGRQYYAQRRDCRFDLAGDWVKQNVLPHLTDFDTTYWGPVVGTTEPWRFGNEIAKDLLDFCDPEKYGKPEFWAYYADYDWVALCQIFGTMIQLPQGWPMYCRDIKQYADQLQAYEDEFCSNPDHKIRLPEQGEGEHHALADAAWNRQAWEYLRSRDPCVATQPG